MNGFQVKQIERCVNNFEVLNAWEQDFIESLDDLPESKELSEARATTLNQIDTKVSQGPTRIRTDE